MVPYSAVQLGSYELLKQLFKNDKGELNVPKKLAAGAIAGICSTFVSPHCCYSCGTGGALLGDLSFGYTAVSTGSGSRSANSSPSIQGTAERIWSVCFLPGVEAGTDRHCTLHGTGTGVVRHAATLHAVILSWPYSSPNRHHCLLPTGHRQACPNALMGDSLAMCDV